MRELKTERLRLRYITRKDVTAIFEGWANDPEVTRYLTWNAHETTADTERIMDFWLEEYKQPDCYNYGIERLSDGALMGMITVVGYHHGNPVIGYCSGRRYWGNGYMTEALKAVIQELFADGYKAIRIEAAKDNIASNRVIEKAGFKFANSREDLISEIKPVRCIINSYILRNDD
ncbi:MAG: GNAT family N-acetyltransferase [Oscillospiraceae bacterium]